MMDCEALVIGGGPVGLVAALCLHDRGVSVRVLDAGGERAVRGYACGLHPGTLRILDQLGLMPTILDAAHRIDRLSLRNGSASRASVDFASIEGAYPYALALRQFDLEEILGQALQRRGVEVLRHHAVAHLYRRHGFVTVTGNVQEHRSVPTAADSPTPARIFEYKANYVIGADGYFSVCRRGLGIELMKLRPTRAFAVAEFNADLRDWTREACLAFTPETVTAFWPLGPELGRFAIQVFESLDETVTLEGLRKLLHERAPWFTPVPEQLCWGAVAPFEHALVQRFGEGRTWLAGDAAHSTSPVGFQSMNRGFCESRALADAIASELFGAGRDGPSPHPFAQFEHEQQAEWVRLFGLSSPHAPSSWHVHELSPCLPASGEDFEVLLEQLGAAGEISHPI